MKACVLSKEEEQMRRRIIRIRWTTPILLDEALVSPATSICGLYYISRVWGGHETSLYIGKATNAIRERLRAHKHEWLYLYRGSLYVRIGQIIYPKTVSGNLIDHAESALIFEHGDILQENTDKRQSYSYSGLYRIENVGDIGMLHPFVDMYKHPD